MTGIIIIILAIALYIFPGAKEGSVSNLYIIPAGTFTLFHETNGPTGQVVTCNYSSLIDETQKNSTICAKPNESFRVRLKENSRTGNQWQMTISPGLQIIDKGVTWYDENDVPTRIVGIKGVREWEVTVKESGVQTVKGVLQRPERITGNEPGFSLVVVVG